MLWCDFAVWFPNEYIVVERINFNEEFSKIMVSKARTFYFDTFLPSAVRALLFHLIHHMQQLRLCLLVLLKKSP